MLLVWIKTNVIFVQITKCKGFHLFLQFSSSKICSKNSLQLQDPSQHLYEVEDTLYIQITLLFIAGNIRKYEIDP